MKRAMLALLLTAVSTAHANVWEHAIARGKPDPAQDKYDAEMRTADEAAIQATIAGIAYKEAKNQVERALAAYKRAAAVKPSEGEPYYRIGKLLYTAYFDCTDIQARVRPSPLCDSSGRGVFNRKKAEEVIAAWEEFEQRSPLDPRLSVGPFGENEILFERAILRTKVATKAQLQGAASDYEKILARHAGEGGATERVLGNLAETYMMLGRLEESLETYREALRGASDTSTWYGYAVALDRDENPRQALEIIRSLGRDQRDLFYLAVNGTRGTVFFVPDGEKYYYFALSDEAFGFDEGAIENWRKFISSGAHPAFQPRAKAHLEALMAKKKRKALPIEPWPELFR